MGTSSSNTYIDSGGQQTAPQDIVNELKSGLKRFLDGQSAHPHATEARRHQLAGGQHPQVAVLACSDSRVPVEVIFDAGFGDLFVIRNAGNTNTFGSAGTIEYAVADLGIRVLLVMSHQGCGAVKAAYLTGQDFSPSLSELVNDIKSGLNNHGFSTDDQKTYEQACIAHSRITAEALVQDSDVIRDAVSNKTLLVQPAFLHIDPLSITWLEPLYGKD
jgi:carbonic anhydrase|tara:strand:+ start:171 stop:821 length:651 start_codon:yes stop_codon:yes gene_type:complete